MRRILPILKIIGIFLAGSLLVVLGFFLYFNLSGPAPRQDVGLGVTFSSRYATDLGLDWKAAYTAMLDDLGVRKIRIPVYWDLVEQSDGVYDFSDVDWQLEEASKRNAEVILSIGQRVPRWPECHIPGWVSAEGSDTFRQTKLISLLGTIVDRYKGHSEVRMWQVENEPFLSFGVCPAFDRNFFDSELVFVRKADPSRPVLVTDSGELSTWYNAAKRGDVFGTTMYRMIYSPKAGGYFTYPIGPNFFRFKGWIAGLLSGQEHFIVIELQGEPWANGWVGTLPLDEQFRTMNEDLLRKNIEYAQRVQYPEIYLWGVEWWYWLKEKKDYPALWDTAKEIFQMHG